MLKRNTKARVTVPQLTNSSSDNVESSKKQWRLTSLGRQLMMVRLVGRVCRVGKRKSRNIEEVPPTEAEKQYDGPELPASVYIAHIFPCLDRQSQDALAEASRDVFLARSRLASSMTWPSGCIKIGRPVMSLTFSKDNQSLIVPSGRKQVHVFDKVQGGMPKLAGHTRPVVAAKYSPDGTMLATAGRSDGIIRLWHSVGGSHTCFRVLQVHHSTLRHVCWSPNNDKIASWGGNGILCISNVSNGQMFSTHWKTRLEVSGCNETVAFSPNGEQVAFAQNSEVVRLWNLHNGAMRTLRDSGDHTRSYLGDYITSLTYCPNEHYLVVGCHVATIKFWRLTPVSSDEDNDDYTFSYYYDFEKIVHLGTGWSAVTLIQFTPDSRYIACTNYGSQIRLVHVETGTVVSSLCGHTGRIEALCFTHDGQTLASGSCDRSVHLWNMSAHGI